MASHTWANGDTIDKEWMQDVNDFVYKAYDITTFGAVAGAAYNTVNPSGLTNDQAFALAFATAHNLVIPEGTFETSLALVAPAFMRISGKGKWLSAINFRTDINASAGLQLTGHNSVPGGLALLGNGGTARVGTGLNVSATTVTNFTGDIQIEDLRISGFATGMNVNNVYWMHVNDLYTYNCTVGIEMSPTTNGGDNGYTTTVDIDNWYAINNDTWHIHANPATQNANMYVKCAIFDQLTSGSATAAGKSYLHNARVKFSTLYAEANPTLPALSIDGGNVSIDNLYLSNTGGVILTSSVCNVTICNATTAAAGDIIYAASSNNTVTICDSNFPASGNIITGNVTLQNSYVNGILANYYQTGNTSTQAVLLDNSPLGAGTVSPGMQWKNGDAQRFSIQMTGGVGSAAAVNFTSSDGAVPTFSANAPVVALGSYKVQSSNGATWQFGHVSELLTLSTAGTTTDTTANLLPANAIIEAVVARVTTTITTATDWKLGDATTVGRFSGASTSLTAGSTVVGTVQADQTGAAGPRQTAAAKVRVTTTGTPGAGAIRITVFYRVFTAPTS